MEVSSYFVGGSGTLIDPLEPPAALVPERIVLTTRHHLRSSEDVVREHGCPILCHESGLHEFEGGPDVQGFRWGDQLAPDVTALRANAISPDDTALLVEPGCLAIADAILNMRGSLEFVPDEYMVDPGDDPEPVKVAIREAFRAHLDLDFDSLLFAHGDPIVGGGKEALRDFVEHGPR